MDVLDLSWSKVCAVCSSRLHILSLFLSFCCQIVLHLHVFIRLSIGLSPFVRLSVHLFLHVSMCLSVSPSGCGPSIWLWSVHLCVCLSVNLLVCLSGCVVSVSAFPAISMHACLVSVCLFICCFVCNPTIRLVPMRSFIAELLSTLIVNGQDCEVRIQFLRPR